jgi:hypothetical protein
MNTDQLQHSPVLPCQQSSNVSDPLASTVASPTVSTDLCHRPSTMAAVTDAQRLLTALDNLACAQPPELFADQFVVSTERTHGGQAVVVFARDKGAGFMHYAIKCAS